MGYPLQHTPQMETENITLRVPLVFGKLACEYYHLDKQRLGEAIIYGFCCEPPRHLIVIDSEAPVESLRP